MKNLLLIISLAFGSTILFGQSQYSKAKIWLLDKSVKELAELGISVDHGTYKENTFLICDFSAEELDLVRNNGFKVDILIDDVKEFYKTQQDSSPKNSYCETFNLFNFNFEDPTNFSLGSMAGYYTYNEFQNIIDEMPQLFPNLISEKEPISDTLTHEGRPVEFLRITSNVNNYPNNKPKVLFSSILHAREPGSLAENIYFMWFLLENYGVSDEITYLLDNTELFFVPMVNPDGYIHNVVNDPNGGGMHRKNKNPNFGTSNPGVDLNRNFSEQWGTTGVSFDENSDVFPGSGPFSEPETQNIKKLVENTGFSFAFNAHTYSNLLLFPIGSQANVLADDHDYFSDLTEHMVFFNNYAAIKSSDLYPASGGSDDYMYLNHDVFAMTPEVGSSFWEPSSQIINDCRDMLFPNLMLVHAVHDYSAIQAIHNSQRISANSGNFEHVVQKLGLENGVVTVSIDPITNIQQVGSPVSYTNMDVTDIEYGEIAYTLSPGLSYGDTIKYALVSDYTEWQRRDTIQLFYGDATLRVLDNANNTDNWSGDWGLSSDEFVSSSNSFHDSPNGSYSPWSFDTYEFNTPLDLTDADAAILRFHAKWNIEAGWDYAQFQVSIDGGNQWIPQCGNFTKPGVSNSGDSQPVGEPLYDGVQSDWIIEEIDLFEYLGESDVRFRFVLSTDGFVNEDGFYFDDFEVRYDPEIANTEKYSLLSLHLYPNPAQEVLNIRLPHMVNSGDIKVRETSGKLVKTINVNKQTDQLTISVGGLENGIYLIQYQGNEGLSETVRFVVSR
jgi:hypothetical protein